MSGLSIHAPAWLTAQGFANLVTGTAILVGGLIAFRRYWIRGGWGAHADLTLVACLHRDRVARGKSLFFLEVTLVVTNPGAGTIRLDEKDAHAATITAWPVTSEALAAARKTFSRTIAWKQLQSVSTHAFRALDDPTAWTATEVKPGTTLRSTVVLPLPATSENLVAALVEGSVRASRPRTVVGLRRKPDQYSVTALATLGESGSHSPDVP